MIFTKKLQLRVLKSILLCFYLSSDLDKSIDFSTGHAGSLLAALVQRRQAMAVATASGAPSPTSTHQHAALYSQMMSQVNGGMGMVPPGMSRMMSSQGAMSPMSPADSVRGQSMASGVSDMSPNSAMYTTTMRKSDNRELSQIPQKGAYSQLLSDNMGRGAPQGMWPGMMGRQMDGNSPMGSGSPVTTQPSRYGQVPSTTTGHNASYPFYPQ